jgi:hypothetical protein
MGNHEYCSACGASHFHAEGECIPEEKARMDFEKRAIDQRTKLANTRAEQVVMKLRSMGYTQAKLNEYGHVVIEKWTLV